MKITFRVDASLEMGTGHVMRCLTLANALKEQGAECHFFCRKHPGNLIETIQQAGFQVHQLTTHSQPLANKEKPLFHAAWLGTTQAQDAEECEAILKQLQPDWLIVDHYALDKIWQQALKPYCKKLMVIDDLVDRQHDCDLLLDQTFGRSSQDYQQLVPEHCQLLCGTEYALLRPEFAQWREFSLKRRKQGQLEHLLINLGGVDKDNITTQILKALSPASLPKNCRITVVMGGTAPWIDAVKQQAAQMPWPTEVKVGVNNMAELMANSDLAIGAAGSTSWERCCLGLPTIMVVLADNQRQIALALADKKAAKVIENMADLAIVVSQLIKELNLLVKYAAKVCDGTGTQKTLGYLLTRA